MEKESAMRLRRTIAIVVVLVSIFLVALVARAQDDSNFVGRTPAPEFPSGLDWVNVPQPLTMAGLRGKIVLFDFWTYGCINCIHMIPVLEQLEQKYANELVIIGVHSAKFSNEGETQNIRQIVQRYNIHHPVINDKDFLVWREYGIGAWPTFVIADPRGNITAAESGEIPFELFDQYISSMIAFWDGVGPDEINREPLELALEGAGDPGTLLLYPGKVLADEASNRLFIVDSNHHRIVIADLSTYEVLDIIGNAQRGLTDGDFATAQFNQPQGIALQGEMLYVADTNNHAIRQVDLTSKSVTTIAGDGRMSQTLAPFGMNYPALTTALRSPWDVVFGDDPNVLYIAMAGMHQIHALNLAEGTAQAVVGTGREAQRNGATGESMLAQPSGIFWADGILYFADSESSTIRAVNFDNDNVRVIAGTSEDNLFDYGDIDGPVGTSKLQHALGVTGTSDGAQIYITDTYNSRIKVIDPSLSVVETIFGLGGDGGLRDGGADVAQFDEPSGLSYANNKLYIADTNNHSVRVIDLDTQQVSTVVFPNVEKLTIANRVTVVGGNQTEGATQDVDEQTIKSGDGTLTLTLSIPDGYKINPLTDSLIDIASSDEAVAQATNPQVTISEKSVAIPFTFASGSATITLDMSLFYCEAQTESVCLIDVVTIRVPVQVSDDAPGSDVMIERVVELPEQYR
jgi:thiol-disulfide isomerase/thioredoxin